MTHEGSPGDPSALDVWREGVVAIDALVNLRRPSAQELGDEDEGERAVDVHRRVAEEIGDADVNAPGAQADRVVQASVRVEAHLDLWRRPARFELTEGVNEEAAQLGLRVGHKPG